MGFRLLTAVTLAATAIGVSNARAAATTVPPVGTTDGESSTYDVRDPFWGEASRACTEVLNGHLDREGEPIGVVLGILEAEAADETPTATSLTEWSDALSGEIARAEAIRSALAAFDLGGPAAGGLWDTVVSAADDAVEVHRTRLAALQTGDWEQIVAAVRSTLGGTGTSGAAFEVIDASPLRGTDCVVVHSWRMPADESITSEFVTAVTDACVTVANRRLASSFADDNAVSLSFLATVLDAEPTDALTVPGELPPALDRIVDEWAATVADFAAIDPALAPTAESWTAITAVPAARLAMFEARRDAVAAGETAAILSAYDRSGFAAHPAWDWNLVGLDGRICASLQH